MPVSVCDPIREALLENLNSSEDARSKLDRQLVTSAKRVLMTHIEYEETGTYQANNLEALKCKYIVLEPNKKIQEKESDNGLSVNKEVLLPEPKKILFPREAVQLGWQNNRRWNVGSGMMNVGNTCYLNSTLQALFHVPSLANWLISETSHSNSCEDNGGCIICAMSKTLLASQNTTGPIKPWLVYSKLRLVCRHLVPGRQEDAHEFLRYLVEAMEKAYLARFQGSKDLDQYSKETTPLNQILGGYLRSTVRCLSCGHVSVTFQHFEDLLLDIRKANTLDEALECYFARERLEDMGYKCEGCKHKVSATKQFSLERPPSVLCIQLKRFSMMGNKINKHIEFGPKLDLSKFLCKNSLSLSYRLVAMVTHIGSSQNYGHYTAIGQSTDGNYYQFDDSSVHVLSLQSMLATNAYIMLYELEKKSASISTSVIPQNPINAQMTNYNRSISECNNERSIKNPIPMSKSLNDSTDNLKLLAIKSGKGENKDSLVLTSPSECINRNQECDKTLNNDRSKIGKQTVQNEENLAPRSLITNGSKSIPNDQSQSMPLLSDESDISVKNRASNLLPHNTSDVVNGIDNNTSNVSKPKTETVNKQIQHLKINGHTNNTSTSNQNIRSLVPYDGSDDSNSEIDSHFYNNNKRQEIINTKATTPIGWKVSNAKDPTLLSPSLNGKAGWSIKKKTNNDIENTLITNSSSDTISQLLRMSHQGYSAPVSTWNGGRSHLEKEIADERREQRKRPVDEMDQGRTKKAKSFNYQGRDNPGYNPFQEYQNSNRWNHHGSGRPPFNNHRRNSYQNNHRGAYRGRYRPYHQRQSYHRR